MEIDTSEKKKIGILNHEKMESDFILYSLVNSEDYAPVSIPDSAEQIEFIKKNNISALVIPMPNFNEKGFKSLLHIAKMIDEIPIVVVSERIEKLVRLNLGFIGRLGYADFNEGLSDIPYVIDQLFNRTEIITRQFLRHSVNAKTKIASCLDPLEATFIDISIGGAKVRVIEGCLEVGQEFSIGIPRGRKQPLIVQAEVVRIDASGHVRQETRAHQIVGIRFKSIPLVNFKEVG